MFLYFVVYHDPKRLPTKEFLHTRSIHSAIVPTCIGLKAIYVHLGLVLFLKRLSKFVDITLSEHGSLEFFLKAFKSDKTTLKVTRISFQGFCEVSAAKRVKCRYQTNQNPSKTGGFTLLPPRFPESRSESFPFRLRFLSGSSTIQIPSYPDLVLVS